MGGIKENKIKQRLKKVHRLKNWQLFLILLPLLFLDATFLRLDHIKMTELRDAVIAADEEENDEKIASTLSELKEFVFSHIIINVVDSNGLQQITFGTGPFYLEHQYRRAAAAALEKAEQSIVSDDNPNGNIYLEASNTCRSRAYQYSWTGWDDQRYIDCMLSEIEKYPSSSELQDKVMAAIPSTELYRKNYASPVWAFSASGITIALTAIILLIFLIRVIVWVILKITILFI